MAASRKAEFDLLFKASWPIILQGTRSAQYKHKTYMAAINSFLPPPLRFGLPPSPEFSRAEDSSPTETSPLLMKKWGVVDGIGLIRVCEAAASAGEMLKSTWDLQIHAGRRVDLLDSPPSQSRINWIFSEVVPGKENQKLALAAEQRGYQLLD